MLEKIPINKHRKSLADAPPSFRLKKLKGKENKNTVKLLKINLDISEDDNSDS